jgi:hypothetical protein
MEQNVETLRRGHSSSISPASKDEPDPTVINSSRDALASSTPQPRSMPGERAPATSPVASLPEPDHQSGREPRAAHDESPVPRLLAMTPKRFPGALRSSISQRNDITTNRPTEPLSSITIGTSPGPHRDTGSGAEKDSETAHEATEIPSPSARQTLSPNLPPPFSRTPRGINAEYNARAVRDNVLSDVGKD